MFKKSIPLLLGALSLSPAYLVAGRHSAHHNSTKPLVNQLAKQSANQQYNQSYDQSPDQQVNQQYYNQSYGQPQDQSYNQQSPQQYNQSQDQSYSQSPSEKVISGDRACALRCLMNKLWAEHVLWTRQFIISSIARFDDVDAVTERLLKNQDDLGHAIVPFYGVEAGRRFAMLLREHIEIYAKLVGMTLKHEKKKVKELYEQWYMNSSALAVFLNQLGPCWNKEELNRMFDEHLRLTEAELELRIKRNWVEDIANFDAILKHALMLGKVLTDGITKQNCYEQPVNQSTSMHVGGYSTRAEEIA